jgi:large subunit ribosomal protein L23
MRENIKLYDVLQSIVVTEKSKRLEETQNQFMFNVALTATKKDIKEAIEHIFNVKVVSVNTLIRKGKRKIFKGRPGQRSDVKKAFVRLAEGSLINFEKGV